MANAEGAARSLLEHLDSLASRRVLLFGGKGGVGKTTVSAAAALHFAQTRPTILFTTDPASNLSDLLASGASSRLTIEALDAEALYAKFLERNLEPFLEIGDRGTYLDREELRRFFQLSLPGIDELMAWMRIGELAEASPDSLLVVDTAPTGHTVRMLSSSGHFRQLVLALDAMQEKHRVLVEQFTRRRSHDAIDEFIDDFEATARRRRELLGDAERTAFVPVMLSEPLVVEQTQRLIGELDDFDIPFVVLNRAHGECSGELDAAARAQLAPRIVVDAPRACAPLDSAERLLQWLSGSDFTAAAPVVAMAPESIEALQVTRTTFLAGKGGVGKTSCAASIALQLATRNSERRYVVISVDPAHSLRDLFNTLTPPQNLSVETIDTKAKWTQFRNTFGGRIEDAVSALAPRGMSIAYDVEAMQRLIEMAPPGADELFAITRLSDLLADDSIAGVIVDTAPTGHFLRLLDLPHAAGEWVREFMRILLHYRDLVPPGSLAEELVRASRALKELEASLRSADTSVIVVTRPERMVVAETNRLIADLRGRGIHVGGVIANYLTPENDCACDRSMRRFEIEALAAIGGPAVMIARRDRAPRTVDDLRGLVPLA